MGWLPEWLGGAPPPPKKKICCACPETKGPRDACVTEHGASGGRVARAPPPVGRRLGGDKNKGFSKDFPRIFKGFPRFLKVFERFVNVFKGF